MIYFFAFYADIRDSLLQLLYEFYNLINKDFIFSFKQKKLK